MRRHPVRALVVLAASLAAPPVSASNMGFRIDTSFPVRDGAPNLYVLSLPGFPGTADVADPAATPPCSEAGAPRADGVIDAADLLCELWTSRRGGMTLTRWENAASAWQHRTIAADPATGDVILSGDWVAPLVSGEALLVEVTGPADGTVLNACTITGSHDPSRNCVPHGRFGFYDVFYHTMFETADELLCGLEDVDWVDADADGFPDTCTGGLYDPASRGAVAVAAFDAPRTGSGLLYVRTVQTVFGSLRFTGLDFRLSVPDGAYVVRSDDQPATVSPCQPHF